VYLRRLDRGGRSWDIEQRVEPNKSIAACTARARSGPAGDMAGRHIPQCPQKTLLTSPLSLSHHHLETFVCSEVSSSSVVSWLSGESLGLPCDSLVVIQAQVPLEAAFLALSDLAQIPSWHISCHRGTTPADRLLPIRPLPFCFQRISMVTLSQTRYETKYFQNCTYCIRSHVLACDTHHLSLPPCCPSWCNACVTDFEPALRTEYGYDLRGGSLPPVLSRCLPLSISHYLSWNSDLD